MIWKLLKEHISILQLVGFFFANLLGMLIILLSLQFYEDLGPAFTSEDSFIHNDYLIVSKKISSMGGLTGSQTTAFTDDEINQLRSQSFAQDAAPFTASQYNVSCYMGIENVANIGTEMFFEAVPDAYVDAPKDQWVWTPESAEVPIILPRTYLAIYNFGFAQSRSLPKMSEGIISQLSMNIVFRGNAREERLPGRIVGFSNRLNTILVPQTFIEWSNARYAPEADLSPTRLILKVSNPTDQAISEYINSKGYEIADDKLDASRTTYFLRIVSAVIMSVGLLISILSFYILMLSVYLLVQKNTQKLQNLLLIGYTVRSVSLPYQLLTTAINVSVLLISLIILFILRSWYMQQLWTMFPNMQEGNIVPVLSLSLVLFVMVSIFNTVAIYRKINSIQH